MTVLWLYKLSALFFFTHLTLNLLFHSGRGVKRQTQAWFYLNSILLNVSIRPGVSSLIRKQPVWVQVFVPTQQKPHFSLWNAKRLIKQCSNCLIGM